MALSFLGAGKKRDHLISVDLGGRTTKAAYIERRSDRLALAGYTLLDAPIYEKTLSAEMLADHLKIICEQLKPKSKAVTLAIGVSDALVRHTELPQMPVGDMRQILKTSPKNYLQQDLPGHLFDCYIVPPKAGDPKPDNSKPAGGPTRFRVLVAGAKASTVDAMQTAIKSAGLIADHVVPGVIGPVNAFEAAMPELFSKETVALVDIGFKHTTISVLQEGELALSRVVSIGGDRITTGLAESMGISYAEAEGIKIGMPAEVETHLEGILMPLGRELRASIDFFEHQRDKAVSQVFLSGASSRSEFIVQTLQRELIVECKTWSPLGGLEMALSPQQAAEIENVACDLTTALGAAYATF
jgi:type IV pilus assembly protein PilM